MSTKLNLMVRKNSVLYWVECNSIFYHKRAEVSLNIPRRRCENSEEKSLVKFLNIHNIVVIQGDHSSINARAAGYLDTQICTIIMMFELTCNTIFFVKILELNRCFILILTMVIYFGMLHLWCPHAMKTAEESRRWWPQTWAALVRPARFDRLINIL